MKCIICEKEFPDTELVERCATLEQQLILSKLWKKAAKKHFDLSKDLYGVGGYYDKYHGLRDSIEQQLKDADNTLCVLEKVVGALYVGYDTEWDTMIMDSIRALESFYHCDRKLIGERCLVSTKARERADKSMIQQAEKRGWDLHEANHGSTTPAGNTYEQAVAERDGGAK